MKPLVIGHRGAMGYEPENTISSFKKALEIGVDVIELDIHKTIDNAIVVIHDDKVDRTTKGKGYVRDLTLKETKKLRVPSLQDVFDFVKKRVKIAIEIKCDSIEDSLNKLIIKNRLVEDVFIISFLYPAIKKIKQINPKLKTGMLFAIPLGNPVLKAKKLKADIIMPRINLVSRELVEKAHKNKLKVIVWNTEDPEEIKKLISWKVDGIASNKPDIVKKIIENC